MTPINSSDLLEVGTNVFLTGGRKAVIVAAEWTTSQLKTTICLHTVQVTHRQKQITGAKRKEWYKLATPEEPHTINYTAIYLP